MTVANTYNTVYVLTITNLLFKKSSYNVSLHLENFVVSVEPRPYEF